MISKETLTILREQLPTGFAVKIHTRLHDKGLEYSISYINRVINPDDPAMNEFILSEAILVRDESSFHRSRLEDSILNPKTQY